MGYTVTSTTAPTIASSRLDVEATIAGGVLGLTRVGIGQQAAAGDTVRLFGTIGYESTLEDPVTLTIPLPYKAAAAPLCPLHFGTHVLAFALNSDSTAIEATFTAAVETGAFYISIEYQTATANT
jgi:hypothetical protein